MIPFPSHPDRVRRADARRRGSMMPALAMAFLVVGAVAALVLNRLWKDAAEVELQTVAEAAALAAAGSYLSDQLLMPNVDQEALIQQARLQAARVARQNRMAGQPVELDLSEDQGDIVFGQRVLNPEENGTEQNETIFLQTSEHPDTVEVRARRMRSLGNPLPFFFGGVSGRSTADAQVIAEVAIDNVISHFQPTNSLRVPALPLAILENDPQGVRLDTWEAQIDQRQGRDEYRFDAETRQVVAEPDGIPEMELLSVAVNGDPLTSNVQLLDFANDLGDQRLGEQILQGIQRDDLQFLNFQISAQQSQTMAATAQVTTPIQEVLESQIGQQKICLLYHQAKPLTVPGWTSVTCQGVVAIRILRIIPGSGETARIIVQPTVMTTQTAVLARFLPFTVEELDNDAGIPISKNYLFPNHPYIYKIYVSR